MTKTRIKVYGFQLIAMADNWDLEWHHDGLGVVVKIAKKGGDYVRHGSSLATVKCAPPEFSFADLSAVLVSHREAASRDWDEKIVKATFTGKVLRSPQVRLLDDGPY